MGRTSLLIRLSPEDAARIRERAWSEYRSVSGYLLYVLQRSFRIEELVVRDASASLISNQARGIIGPQIKKGRTADLEEARDAADPSLNSRLAIIYDQVSDVAKTTHEISHGLHPTFLKHSGLGVALRALCRRIGTEKSLQVSFIDGTQPTSTSIEISVCLYRVAQEALQNVAKHSHAQSVIVELNDKSDRISLRIVDDGIGFNMREERMNGLGLISMLERVRLIGGTLRIRSSPNSGTTIEAFVPLATTPSGRGPLASD